MSENDDGTANFLNGILSQPVLSEDFTQGFAARDPRDKNLLNTIIRSQRIDGDITAPGTIDRHMRKDNTSKVDRIISDFLTKVKERAIHSEKSTSTIKERTTHLEEPHYQSIKRNKSDYGHLRYFEKRTPSVSQDPRTNIFIPEVDDNKFFPGNSEFRGKENYDYSNTRQSVFLRHSQYLDMESDPYTNTADYNNRDGAILSQRRQALKFPCHAISPIEYPKDVSHKTLNEYSKTIYVPNAFSTPLQPDFDPQRGSVFNMELGQSARSVGTQTQCSHKCLMCPSSPYKKVFNNIEYLFEE